MTGGLPTGRSIKTQRVTNPS